MDRLWVNVLAAAVGALGTGISVTVWIFADRLQKMGRLNQSGSREMPLVSQTFTTKNLRIGAASCIVIGVLMIVLACFGLFS